MKDELLKAKLSLRVRKNLGVRGTASPVVSWRVCLWEAGAAAAFERVHPCNLILCFASTVSKDVFAVS